VKEVPVLSISDALSMVVALRKRQEGQTFAEYAIVLAVLAIGVTVALGAFTKGITGALTKVTSYLPS
jgi:Flp pilus assembly pilin Flp